MSTKLVHTDFVYKISLCIVNLLKNGINSNFDLYAMITHL